MIQVVQTIKALLNTHLDDNEFLNDLQIKLNYHDKINELINTGKIKFISRIFTEDPVYRIINYTTHWQSLEDLEKFIKDVRISKEFYDVFTISREITNI